DVKTAEDNLTNAMQKGDLYTQSYKLAKSNITKKTLDVIEQTKDFLNNNYAYPYTCELTYADTAIILYQNKDIRPRINQLIQAPTP
ncbi:hypothetical protein GW750_05090, partial [bacterium]|nr:hypothetical protein [bacterium]